MSVLTDQNCHCGSVIRMEVRDPDTKGGVGWGYFSRNAADDTHNFALRCVCGKCGLVFDPNHSRFAPYYNRAAGSALMIIPQTSAEEKLEKFLKFTRTYSLPIVWILIGVMLGLLISRFKQF